MCFRWFFNWIFLFLLLCFDSSIIIDNLDTFNQVYGLQITFPQTVACVFILFTWPFSEKRIFFQYLKGCATSSCSSWFQMRNLLAFELVFSLGNVLFLYGCFQEFFLSLFIRSLITMCLGMHFFGFILFGVCSACWIYRSTSFTKLQKFLALIFYFFFFSVQFSFSSAWRFMMLILDLLLFHRSLRFCSCFLQFV